MIRGWWPVLLRTTKYYTGLPHTTKYYTILFHTTKHHTLRLCTTKYYTALPAGAGDRARDPSLSRLTPYPRDIFWLDHIRKVLIANTMRGAIVQIQNRSARAPRTTHQTQFRATDPPNPASGFIQQNQNARFATAACHPKSENLRFATAACDKMYETSAGHPQRKGCPSSSKICVLPTVLDVRRARSDERAARAHSKFAFHQSFGRPMSTK